MLSSRHRLRVLGPRTRQALYSITKNAMRRSADEIGATSISFRPKVFSDATSAVDGIFSAHRVCTTRINHAHGSLERAGSQKAVKQPGSTHGVATREETMTNASSSARGRCVKFNPQAIEKIKELVAEGLSRDEIANRLGVTVGSLQVTCSRLELFRPTAQGPTRPMSRAEVGQVRDNDAMPRHRATE